MTALLRRLRLSIPELDLLARAADLDAFPGLPTDITDGAADGVVIDGLRAHGIVETDGEQLLLREDVTMLLRAILNCEVSLQVETTTAESTADAVIIHLHEDIAILQHASDGIVSLLTMPAAETPRALLSLCGADPDAAYAGGTAASMRIARDALTAVEQGERDAAPELAGYLMSVTAPERAGRAAARGTLHGELRAACAWVAGPGGTYVLHDDGEVVEIVRADGNALASELLSLLPKGPSSA